MNRKFDIFISFKATDQGEVTSDVAVATELYNMLIASGFNVFFSSETLALGGSSDFSKEIDTALDDAKLLIVVSSKLEYVCSRWVEYEWKTFNADILSDVKSDAQIITFTDGINSKDLPRILRYVQNFSYAEMSDLLTFVTNFFDSDQNKKSENHLQKTISAGLSKSKLLKKDHTLYNSAASGQFEILRLRERRSYALDMRAIDYVKGKIGKKKYNVLVLGCAYGFVAETRFGLDDDVENVICVDKNADVLAKAKEIYSNYPHMKFYQIDLQSDDYVFCMKNVLSEVGIESIDIIFASDLFRHLNNPQLTIRNSRKLLASNGMLIVRDCDDSNKIAYPDNKGVLREIVECSQNITGMPNYYIGRELPLLIRNGGFDICEVNLDIYTTINMTFDEKEEFFFGTFGSRKSIAQQVLNHDTSQKDELDKLVNSIDKMEAIFYDLHFWYSESNMIVISKKS